MSDIDNLRKVIQEEIKKVLTESEDLKTPLYGHTDENSAYLVNDYPYGFKLRTKIRYWLESDPKKGFRFVSQTMNPKTERWNAPKKSTYSTFGGCMYLDNNDHVQWSGVTEYSDAKNFLEYINDFPKADFSLIKKWAAAKIYYYKKIAAGTHALRTTVNGVLVPVTDLEQENEMNRAKEEVAQWEEIAKLVGN